MFWAFCVAGALVVVGLGRVARLLGIVGLWAYLIITVATGLSAALAVVLGIVDLPGVTGRSKHDIRKLWQAQTVIDIRTGNVALADTMRSGVWRNRTMR